MDIKVRNNLYLVSLPDSYKLGYDSYNAFIACCKTEKEARETHPIDEEYSFNEIEKRWEVMGCDNIIRHYGTDKYNKIGWIYGKDISQLEVTLLGIANDNITESIVLKSYNAG